MVAAIRILGLIIIMGTVLFAGAVLAAIAAAIGVVIHFALIGAPVLLFVIIAIRDAIIKRAYKRWLKQQPPIR